MSSTRVQLDLTGEQLRELEALMERLGLRTKKDLFNNALMLLEWAANERASGRIIAAVDEQQNRYKQVMLPALERLAPTSQVNQA